MDISEAERALQANLGPDLGHIGHMDGFDNAGIDFGQLEDLINGSDNVINFDERNFDDSVPTTSTNSINGYHQQPPPQQQQQQQHMNGPGGMIDTVSCHKGPSPHQRVPPAAHQPPHNPYPHHQQQQHQQQAVGNAQQQQQQQQQQLMLNPHKNNQFCTQLPESPPDSGSEPYSPPTTANHQTDQTDRNFCPNVKSNIMTTLSQQQQQPANHQQQQQGMYMNSMNGVGPPHSSVTPPHTQVSPVSHPQHRPNGYSNPYMLPNMGAEPPKLNHNTPGGPVQPITLNPQMLPYPVGAMNNFGTQPNPKKRKTYESPTNTVSPGVMNGMGLPIHPQPPILNIKSEPVGTLPDCDDDSYPYDMCSEMNPSFLDGSYQVIKWQMFQLKNWCPLLDHNGKALPSPSYRVDADKGFNFAVPDDAFVCQKKNHFQVTAHMEIHGHPKFVKTPEEQIKAIDSFFLHFKGIKVESPAQSIKIEQSQSDRSKKPFYPCRVDLPSDQVQKVTVGRLHFSETTTNNMRKKGKPNPDQRYFMLVVSLHAHCGDESYMVAAQVSERIIVRASNPGQFDQDVDVTWQKGHTSDSVYHAGRVGINTDRPDEHLTVHGNVKVTGHVMQPSDKRIKTDIKELDPKEQLKNISSIKVYNYGYDNQYADYVGMPPDDMQDTGVIAQEVREVLPDAVKETGDLKLPNGVIENLQVVNKDRIYMENVGAVKELCKVTDKLENRINELETMNKKLSKFGKSPNKGSIKSTCSTMSLSTCSTISHTSSMPRLHSTKWEKEFTKDKDTKELENQEKQDQSEKSEKKSHSHPRHHCHRHHRHHHSHRSQSQTPAQEEGLCTNRFIQVTIVILVLVMAFCLISITTLYVMERQQPTSSFNAENSTQIPPDKSDKPSKDPWSLPVSPTTPDHLKHELIPSRCVKDPEACSIVCCSDILDDPGNPKGTTTTDSKKGPPYVTVKPQNNNQHNQILKPNISVIGVHGVAQGVPQVSGYRVSNNTPKDKPIVKDMDEGKRKRRSAASVEEKATLVIRDLNATVDNDYCSNNACINGVGYNFTYYIPVSPLFGRHRITLAFQLTEDFYVDLCEHKQTIGCDNKKLGTEPMDHTPESHAWTLPVGFYRDSYYEFRVTLAANKENLCDRKQTQTGQDFATYWLFFQRRQSDTCPKS